jgi:hypothetical protein
MMINEDYNRYYDWKNYRLNHDVIQSRIDRLREMKYTNNLIDILSKMLRPDDSDRPDLVDLCDILHGQWQGVGSNMNANNSALMMNPLSNAGNRSNIDYGKGDGGNGYVGNGNYFGG